MVIANQCALVLCFRWHVGLAFVLLIAKCQALFNASLQIESARLYGNADEYAYYFVDLLVGMPPQRVSVIVDTGSSMAAFPCANCEHCGQHIDPAFNFSGSQTAYWMSCDDRCPGTCSDVHGVSRCFYRQGYTEGSFIEGYMFEDMVSLGDTLQHNPPVRGKMGCHQNENKLFYTQQANGILGLGPSSRSTTILETLFRDQEHVDARVFSICLAEWGGRLSVGGYNSTYHVGAVNWVKMTHYGHYSVHMLNMVVGAVVVGQEAGFGYAIVDSGTTRTYMSSENYHGLRRGIEEYCRKFDCRAKQTGSCFKVSAQDGIRRFPRIKVTFYPDIETHWEPRAYLYLINRANDWCYAFEDDGPGAGTVLGISWMMHKDIIFDFPKKRIGIANAACPEFRLRPPPPPPQYVSKEWSKYMRQHSINSTKTTTTQPFRMKVYAARNVKSDNLPQKTAHALQSLAHNMSSSTAGTIAAALSGVVLVSCVAFIFKRTEITTRCLRYESLRPHAMLVSTGRDSDQYSLAHSSEHVTAVSVPNAANTGQYMSREFTGHDL